MNNIFIAETKFPLTEYCGCLEDWGNPLITTTVKFSKNNGMTFETLLPSDSFPGGPIWFANFQNETYLDNYPNLLLTSGNSNEEMKNRIYSVRIFEKYIYN